MKRGAQHPYHLAAIALVAAACGFAQSTDFIAAAGRGDLPAVNAFLRAGADVNQTKSTASGSTTALAAAASMGHLEVVQALLAAKADVNGGAIPALYYAAMLGNLDMVRALLAAKPNLDWRDPTFGTTARMQALAPWRNNLPTLLPFPRGRWDVARLLVEAGANVNVMSKTGVTALMLVAEENSPRSLEMTQVLLAAHADPNAVGTAEARPGVSLSPLSDGGNYARSGYTPLGLAASTGNGEVVQALLAANARRAAHPALAVNAKQPGGNTALTLASAKGRLDVVRLLLTAQADVGASDDTGKTALMLAVENDHPEVAELLRSSAAGDR